MIIIKHFCIKYTKCSAQNAEIIRDRNDNLI